MRVKIKMNRRKLFRNILMTAGVVLINPMALLPKPIVKEPVKGKAVFIISKNGESTRVTYEELPAKFKLHITKNEMRYPRLRG